MTLAFFCGLLVGLGLAGINYATAIPEHLKYFFESKFISKTPCPFCLGAKGRVQEVNGTTINLICPVCNGEGEVSIWK
jgi:hypothetical protein